jgi:hypothetical protein
MKQRGVCVLGGGLFVYMYLLNKGTIKYKMQIHSIVFIYIHANIFFIVFLEK